MDLHPRSVTGPSTCRRTLAVVAAGAASVMGVGGLAYALTADGATAGASAVTAPAPVPTGASVVAAAGAQAQARARHRLGLLRRAVHVEIVVAKAGGGFRTIDIDRGTVTAASSTSVTVTPPGGRAPVTAAITSATREPKGAPTQSERVVLVSSDGDALLIRPVVNVAGAVPSAGNTGVGASGNAVGGEGAGTALS